LWLVVPLGTNVLKDRLQWRAASDRIIDAEEVASVIFEAATDGTDQFRYIPTEDIKPLVVARRETSEAE